MFSTISDLMKVFEIILPRVANDFFKCLPDVFITLHTTSIFALFFFLKNFTANLFMSTFGHFPHQQKKKQKEGEWSSASGSGVCVFLVGNNKEIDQNRFAQIVFIAIYSARSVINARINFI